MNQREMQNYLFDLLKDDEYDKIISFILKHKITKIPKNLINNILLRNNFEVFKFFFDNNLIEKNDVTLNSYLSFTINNIKNSTDIAELLINNIKEIKVKKILNSCISKGDFVALEYFQKRFNQEITIMSKIQMTIKNYDNNLFLHYLLKIKINKTNATRIIKNSIKYNNTYVLNFILDNYNFSEDVIWRFTNKTCESKNLTLFKIMYNKTNGKNKQEYFTIKSFENFAFDIFYFLFDPLKTKEETLKNFKDFTLLRPEVFQRYPSVIEHINEAYRLVTNKNKILAF